MDVGMKERIRKAALELFKKISYSKTSVSDIASAAGIGKGTIYLYYKSKDEIMGEILNLKISAVNGQKNSYYLSNQFTFKEKLEKFISFLIDSFLEIKSLLFGSFENLQGRITRDVFANYAHYNGQAVLFLIDVMKFEGLYPESADYNRLYECVDEFFNVIVGRTILYVLDTDWDNLEPLKVKVNNVVHELFTALVINKIN